MVTDLSVVGDGAVVPPGARLARDRLPAPGPVKALVTGGAGFIGSTLVDRLLAEGHAVDVVDNLTTGSLANLAEARRSPAGRLTFHQLDIRSPDLAELMNRCRPEVVFHLAAQADVRVSVADPVFDADVNVIGSLRVLEGARSSGARKVVFASSGGTIYGNPDPADLPVKESHPQRPLSPTGCPRRSSATTWPPTGSCTTWSSRPWPWPTCTGPARILTARPAWSPSSPAGCWPASRAPSTGTAPRPGTSSSSTTWSTPSPGRPSRGGGLVLNIGTGTETSVNDLYAAMAAHAGVDRPGRARPGPARASCSAAAWTRAGPAIHLGWKPWTSLDEGTAAVLDWFRDQALTRLA